MAYVNPDTGLPEPNTLTRQCPDGVSCRHLLHHDCKKWCWRRDHNVARTPTGEWPESPLGFTIPDPRLPWDEYFLKAAEWASLRSSCPRARCGAAIVVDRRVITTGYNGSPPGDPHCFSDGCQMEDGHCQRAIHAEVNAITQASITSANIKGGTIYIYRDNIGGSVGAGACRECLKHIRAAGLIVYGDPS